MAAKELLEICVMGAGAFGTAMAFVAASNGHAIRLCARDEEQVRAINEEHRNPKHLSEFELPPNIVATTDVAAALSGAALVIHALPAQRTPEWLRENRELIPPNAVFCCTAKGLYLKGKQLLSEAMQEALARPQRLTYLSGPSFAKEIMIKSPTAVVVAGSVLPDAVVVQRAMSSKFFRVYTSLDVVGVQLGGALKNPLAVGAGVIDGKGFGINTKTAVLTRACRELSVLSVAMGGKPETVAGLSGVGDLMLTAFGDLSRNRSCGLRLAKGESLASILEGMTVEGVPTAAVAVDFANRCGLDLPIFATVHAILNGEMDIEAAWDKLMARPLGTEMPLL